MSKTNWPAGEHVSVACPWCAMKNDVGIVIVRDQFCENELPATCVGNELVDGGPSGCLKSFLVSARQTGLSIEKLYPSP